MANQEALRKALKKKRLLANLIKDKYLFITNVKMEDLKINIYNFVIFCCCCYNFNKYKLKH